MKQMKKWENETKKWNEIKEEDNEGKKEIVVFKWIFSKSVEIHSISRKFHSIHFHF